MMRYRASRSFYLLSAQLLVDGRTSSRDDRDDSGKIAWKDKLQSNIDSLLPFSISLIYSIQFN